jgi:glycerate-2-kinase
MDGMDRTARAFLESLFRSAVAAAHPAAMLPANQPERRQAR